MNATAPTDLASPIVHHRHADGAAAGHAHAHDHAHSHGAGHLHLDDGAATPRIRPPRSLPFSLIRASIVVRLGIVAVLSAAVWGAIVWAITPIVAS